VLYGGGAVTKAGKDLDDERVVHGWLRGIGRAKEPANGSVVFTRDEKRAVLPRLNGVRCVMASRLYSFGLRLMEYAGPVRIKTRPGNSGFDLKLPPLLKDRPRAGSRPWHRASWVTVRCCSGGGTAPLRTGWRRSTAARRRASAPRSWRTSRRQAPRALGIGRSGRPRRSSRLMLPGAVLRSWPGGPRSCGRSGGCRRPGHIAWNLDPK
jgi:hypothetical protein